MRTLIGLFGPYTQLPVRGRICGLVSPRDGVDACDGGGTCLRGSRRRIRRNAKPQPALCHRFRESWSSPRSTICGAIAHRAPAPVVFESSNTGNPGAEDSPELTLTLNATNGLVSGASYDIYVAYWSATGQNWSVQGRLPGGNPTLFNRTGPLTFLPNAVAGASAASAIWTTAPGLHCRSRPRDAAGQGRHGHRDRRTDQRAHQRLADHGLSRRYSAGQRVHVSLVVGRSGVHRGGQVADSRSDHRPQRRKTQPGEQYGQPVSFTSISITSASQALSATSWRPITNFYDQGAGLDTDSWEITAPTLPLPAFAPALTEIESVGGTGRRNLGLGRPRRSIWEMSGATRVFPTCKFK